MTIAVTYEKETGNVFQHFGKTEYFKLYQIEVGNPNFIRANSGITRMKLQKIKN